MVRFVALGDGGEGNTGQLDVAAAVAAKCLAAGCDFVVLLGDNIYPSGAGSVEDERWQTHFEVPYQNINLPFWAVLGNHDYGGDGGGYEFYRGPVAVAYSQVSSKWRMPATHYTFSAGPVGFLALDTNSIYWGNTNHGDQAEWVGPALMALDTPWKVALGHHTFISNGRHGNAGNYDGIPGVSATRIISGLNVKEFVEEHVCGGVDLFLNGHDHNRQWLEPVCGMEVVVSGSGATLTGLEGDNPTRFEDAAHLGFLWAEVTATSFRGQFINVDGSVAFERTLQR